MKRIILSLLFVLPLLAMGQVDSAKITIPTTTEADSIIFEFSEMMPEFNADDDGLQAFIAKNIVYPDSAQKKGIQGTVFAQFIVEKDGSVSNLRIAKGIGYGCDEEVIRVMKKATFKPGTQKGKPVRVRMGMPVKFKLK
jgi:periplasmic protein TonB